MGEPNSDLPEPPRGGLLSYLKALGPGVIMASLAIGAGEWILFPALVVKVGPYLLWAALLACVFQAVLAVESMKYPVYCGQPIHKAYQKLPPGPLAWAWAWALLLFIPIMWPGWALASATAVAALQLGRLPGPGDSMLILGWGIVALLVALLILHIGKKIERTLELISWPLVILLFATVLAGVVVAASPEAWATVGSGVFGFLKERLGFPPPDKTDWFLLAAAIAYIPAGFGFNLMLSSYARDKGWGMGEKAGYISAMIGGKKVPISTEEKPFTLNPENLRRWRGWLNIVKVDAVVVFAALTFLTLLMTSVMAYALLTPRGLAPIGFMVAAAQAEALADVLGPVAWVFVLLGGFWILFDTQWGLMDAVSRVITDNFWLASERVRRWVGGDPRKIYYTVVYTIFAVALVIMVGAMTLKWARPFELMATGAILGLFALVIAYILQVIVNYKYFPRELRPSPAVTTLLVGGAALFGFFLIAVLLQALAGITI